MSDNWRHRAECRKPEYDAELWFPAGNTGPALLQIAEAKAVCDHRCPVVDSCLQWALETRQDGGVWGGLSEGERRQPPPCGTSAAYRRHQVTGESCPACTEAHERRQKRPRPTLAPCGTRAAYQRHRKDGEPIDDACRAANTEASRRLRTTGTTKLVDAA